MTDGHDNTNIVFQSRQLRRKTLRRIVGETPSAVAIFTSDYDVYLLPDYRDCFSYIGLGTPTFESYHSLFVRVKGPTASSSAFRRPLLDKRLPRKYHSNSSGPFTLNGIPQSTEFPPGRPKNKLLGP